MKKIIAINGSPRSGWNTDILVREAAAGAASGGAEVEVIDLYKMERFTGCVSCFGCKTEGNLGRCVCRDGLHSVLETIRHADGLIMGSPVYLGEISAGLRALYERLIFPYITYKTEVRSYQEREIPVVLILTSNAPAESYADLAAGIRALWRRLSALCRFSPPAIRCRLPIMIAINGRCLIPKREKNAA